MAATAAAKQPPPEEPPRAAPLSAEGQRIFQEVMEAVNRRFRDLAAGVVAEKQRGLPARRDLMDVEGEEGAKVFVVTLENAPTARVKAANEGEAWMRYKEKTGLTASAYTPVIGEVKQ
jgi:hypothetical protein